MLQQMRSGGKWFMVGMAAIFVAIFVFGESSGLLGRGPVTTTTAVAKVNGEEILATDWFRATEQRAQQEQQRAGRALTLDEREQIGNAVFDEMVTGVLLRQEIAERRISVTDQEIQQLA